MDEHSMACRHLGQFFTLAVEYDMDEIDFTLKALCSDYKKGIEKHQLQWYSQSEYYYFEEFMKANTVKSRMYVEDEKEYEKGRMYWLGFCLQAWSNNIKISGEKIAGILGKAGVEYLLRNYKMYQTEDPMYVFNHSEDCLKERFHLSRHEGKEA